MGNIAPKCFSTIFGMSTKYPESFIKIDGQGSEKNGNNKQTDIHLLLLGYIFLFSELLRVLYRKFLH